MAIAIAKWRTAIRKQPIGLDWTLSVFRPTLPPRHHLLAHYMLEDCGFPAPGAQRGATFATVKRLGEHGGSARRLEL